MNDLIIKDPYAGHPDEDKVRLNADVPKAVALRIKVLCPYRGIFQAMINTLIASIVNETEKRGIIYNSDENYHEFIKIILRRATPWTSTDGSEQTRIAGGTAKVCARPPRTTKERANTPSPAGVRRQPRGKDDDAKGGPTPTT
jgi:hypothetical protein